MGYYDDVLRKKHPYLPPSFNPEGEDATRPRRVMRPVSMPPAQPEPAPAPAPSAPYLGDLPETMPLPQPPASARQPEYMPPDAAAPEEALPPPPAYLPPALNANGTDTRRRVADPLQQERVINQAARNAPAARTNPRGFLGHLADIGKGVGRGALEGLASGNGLGGALGGAIYGGARQGIKHDYLGQLDQRKDIAKSDERLGMLEKQADEDLGRQAKQAQIANTVEDNALNREYKLGQLERQTAADRERAIGNIWKRAGRSKVFNPATLSPAERAALKESEGYTDEEINALGYDLRPDAKEHTVNGVRYRLNRQTGAYEPTNLPADASAQLVEVKTDDGTVYKVPQKLAYQTKEAFRRAQVLQEGRQAFQAQQTQRQQQFQAQQNQLNREQQQELQRRAQTDGRDKTVGAAVVKWVEIYRQEHNGTNPTNEQTQAYRQWVESQLPQ